MESVTKEYSKILTLLEFTPRSQKKQTDKGKLHDLLIETAYQYLELVLPYSCVFVTCRLYENRSEKTTAPTIS